MLEAIRQNSRNTIMTVFFGVIIAVFVINFGPGSRGIGSEVTSSYAAKVVGQTVSERDFRLAWIALGGPNIPAQFAKDRHLKEFVMDKLIERELLAQEADRLGFTVSQKEVEDMVVAGRMYVLGVPRKAEEFFVDGVFNNDRFRNVCQNRLGVTINRFLEEQQREMLADKVKQLMLGGVKVLPAEVKAEYVQKETQANLEFVRFSPKLFEAQAPVTPEAVAAYRTEHADEIKKYFDDHSYLYKKVEKQAHLRHILVAVKKDEKDQDKVDTAKRKADRAKARVTDKDEPKDFAEVARKTSDDKATKDGGGDLGWKKKGASGLPAALEAQVLAAKAGDLIGPERGDNGFELYQVVGFREGDLPFDQVADEIAADKLQKDGAQKKAKAAAEAAAQKAKEGESLAEQFPKPSDSDAEAAGPKGPSVDETGLFGKKGELVPQLGVSAELARKAFELKPAESAGPFDVSGSFVVVTLKERKEADLAEFEKHKDEQVRTAERQKWAEVLDDWSKQRCNEAKDDGRLKVNDDVLTYEGLPSDKSGEVHYTPCGSNTPKF